MVEQRTETRMTEASLDVECAHHWRIETPAGETSRGTCKICGATRDFANYTQRRATARQVRPPGPASGTNGNGR
jgi:hypothetical protein